jgi:hypothetical protein
MWWGNHRPGLSLQLQRNKTENSVSFQFLLCFRLETCLYSTYSWSTILYYCWSCILRLCCYSSAGSQYCIIELLSCCILGLCNVILLLEHRTVLSLVVLLGSVLLVYGWVIALYYSCCILGLFTALTIVNPQYCIIAGAVSSAVAAVLLLEHRIILLSSTSVVFWGSVMLVYFWSTVLYYWALLLFYSWGQSC